MMRADRLNYLKSRFNIQYLNEIDRLIDNNRYQSFVGINYVPKSLRSGYRLRYFVYLIYLLIPFLCVAYVLKSFVSLIKARHINYNEKYLFLLTSPALPKLINKTDINSDDGLWLSMPWKKDENIPLARQCSVFSFLTFSDIIDAAKDYVATFYYQAKKYGYDGCLDSINCFSWFIYYLAVKRTSTKTTLVFCNQLDKFCVLIDYLPHENKVLVQHGTEIILHNPYNIPNPLYRYNEAGGIWTLNPPFKYKHITRAYVFSEKEIIALRSAILNCDPGFVITGYGTKLTDMVLTNYSILIVGYYELYGNKEEEVLSQLCKKNVIVFVKNHPNTNVCFYDELKKRYKFTLITDHVFPKVDLVITYDSTLGLEYDALGVRVLYYDDFKISDLPAIIEEEIVAH